MNIKEAAAYTLSRITTSLPEGGIVVLGAVHGVRDAAKFGIRSPEVIAVVAGTTLALIGTEAARTGIDRLKEKAQK